MKPFIYMIIFCFVLLSAPVMAAPPNPDPELDAAMTAVEEAMNAAPFPYIVLSCEASGGGYMATFSDVNGPALIIQAVGGKVPEWNVHDQASFPVVSSGGIFTSKGTGYQPWKRYVKNLCVLCMSTPGDCLDLTTSH